MTEVTVTDRSGKTISMLEIDGFKTSFFGHTTEYEKNVYENLPKFQFRQDDIFLASYPKAGGYSLTIWLYFVCIFNQTLALKRDLQNLLLCLNNPEPKKPYSLLYII